MPGILSLIGKTEMAGFEIAFLDVDLSRLKNELSN
jgi:hypothetical protein